VFLNKSLLLPDKEMKKTMVENNKRNLVRHFNFNKPLLVVKHKPVFNKKTYRIATFSQKPENERYHLP